MVVDDLTDPGVAGSLGQGAGDLRGDGEGTGDYWKPFYYLLEGIPGVELMLVNARHVNNLPGRKTDVEDATWLARLGAHCLDRASFVPPEPIRRLRDLTRARAAIIRERSRDVARMADLAQRRLRAKIPAIGRGLGRPVHRPPRLPGPTPPGPDRSAHGRDQPVDRPDRGSRGALSWLPRPDPHHPR